MKKILVVMSCFNGEKYVQEQINSILEQIDVEITLLIRDDGSKDKTIDILKYNADMYKNVKLKLGNNIGFKRSFYETLVNEAGEYDYYAFADQDDVWDKDKLITAINLLEKKNTEISLYASSLRVVNEDMNFMYLNDFNKLRVNFGSALSRQRLAGCTMVFNRKLFEVCKKFVMTEETGELFSHDGAVYYICLACGGTVVYDHKSHISYRRHNDTVTEHGKGFLKRAASVTNVFGKFKNRRFHQIAVLNNIYRSNMPDEIRDITDKVLSYRESFFKTISLMCDKRINCGLISVDLVNKLAVLFHCY